jgi:hypothetical protein
MPQDNANRASLSSYLLDTALADVSASSREAKKGGSKRISKTKSSGKSKPY